MELAAQQSLTEFKSDWSKRQSYEELMTRKIIIIINDKRIEFYTRFSAIMQTNQEGYSS
jgi:hypothetical protein